MNNRDHQILRKIVTEAELAGDLSAGFTLETFSADERTKRAVCMTLINIGELVKNLTDDFKREHAGIQWRAIFGMRDITAHKYQTLRMDDVWETVQKEIPKLRDDIDAILNKN